MEFTRLSEVEVVETANDTDKVLIEQNGEIKRVPKTEVGGGGGNILVLDVVLDFDSGTATGSANMTLGEAIAALNNRELTGAIAYVTANGYSGMDVVSPTDITQDVGSPAIELYSNNLYLQWTADGFTLG